MPTTLYDEDSNPIEGVLTPEEVKELQDKAQKADELEKSIAEREAELSKLKDKELNFTRLKDKTEEEKAKLLEKASSEKKLVLEELMDLRKEREDEKKAKFEEARNMLLEGLAGNDDKLKQSIELRAKQWGEIKTIEEMKQRYSDAFTLERADKPQIRSFNNYFPTTSYTDPQAPKKFSDTEQGKESIQKWFPSLAPKIYKDK